MGVWYVCAGLSIILFLYRQSELLWSICTCARGYFKGRVRHFGKCAYLLPCWELREGLCVRSEGGVRRWLNQLQAKTGDRKTAPTEELESRFVSIWTEQGWLVLVFVYAKLTIYWLWLHFWCRDMKVISTFSSAPGQKKVNNLPCQIIPPRLGLWGQPVYG